MSAPALARQRFHLRSVTLLVGLGFLLTVWNVYEAPEPTILDVAGLAFGGLMVGGAIGLLCWQSWARWLLLFGVAVNFLPIFGVGLLMLRAGRPPWILLLPGLLNLYILSILLHPNTAALLRAGGRLDAVPLPPADSAGGDAA